MMIWLTVSRNNLFLTLEIQQTPLKAVGCSWKLRQKESESWETEVWWKNINPGPHTSFFSQSFRPHLTLFKLLIPMWQDILQLKVHIQAFYRAFSNISRSLLAEEMLSCPIMHWWRLCVTVGKKLSVRLKNNDFNFQLVSIKLSMIVKLLELFL